MFAQWITEEANAAADIKKNKTDYGSIRKSSLFGASANKGRWAKELVEALLSWLMVNRWVKEIPNGLQDDYVNFIAFGQWRIEKRDQGFLGFITNQCLSG